MILTFPIACFLTATKPCQTTKTASVTARKSPVTQTVYKTGAITPTATKTVTVTEYKAGVTLAAPETTETITEVSTQTDHTLTTVIETKTSTSTTTDTGTETSTSTTTATASATVTSSPCDNVESISLAGSVSHPNAVLGISTGAVGQDGTKICCLNCFNNRDCVFFRVGNNLCEIYFNRNGITNPCTSDQCRRGLATLNRGASDGRACYEGKYFNSST